jgi:RNA polymerase sigma-70 factor, ECF subfamily
VVSLFLIFLSDLVIFYGYTTEDASSNSLQQGESMTEISIAGKIPKESIDDDSVLIKEAQKNPQQFKKVYQKWLPSVYRYFYFRVGNQNDAEDLTSQVFIRVYEALPHYENRGCFPAWLFSIARARMVDFYRKNKSDVPLDTVEFEFSMQMDDTGLSRDEILDLLSLIKRLKIEEQELIYLRFFAGLSFAEIGKSLNRKEDTVRKSLSRLLDRMQMKMEA